MNEDSELHARIGDVCLQHDGDETIERFMIGIVLLAGQLGLGRLSCTSHLHVNDIDQCREGLEPAFELVHIKVWRCIPYLQLDYRAAMS